MDKETELIKLVEDFKNSEIILAKKEQNIMMNPEFKEFLELQKAVNTKAEEIWGIVENSMIDNNIKQLKGDFGTISLAEKINWKADLQTLDEKFTKKTIDTTKLKNYLMLNNEVPDGASYTVTKYIVKRLKDSKQLVEGE